MSLRSYANSVLLDSRVRKPRFCDMPFLYNATAGREEDQFLTFMVKDWYEHFGGDVPQDSVEFWGAIKTVPGFDQLATYALTCLLIPSSNAVIERMFSLVAATKTKPRNRLGVERLQDIVRIKSHLNMRKICCKDGNVPPRMLALHTSSGVPKTPRGPLVGGGASCVPTDENEDDVLSYC